MSLTSLTPPVAQLKITQVEEAMHGAQALANNMQGITAQMTSSSWQGNQAALFARKMQQYDDDFSNIVRQLTDVAEKGKHHMMALVNMDSE